MCNLHVVLINQINKNTHSNVINKIIHELQQSNVKISRYVCTHTYMYQDSTYMRILSFILLHTCVASTVQDHKCFISPICFIAIIHSPNGVIHAFTIKNTNHGLFYLTLQKKTCIYKKLQKTMICCVCYAPQFCTFPLDF